MGYKTYRVRPNLTIKIPAALTPGTDYLTPTGSGSQLSGVVHTEVDPVFTASPAATITNGMIAGWNAGVAPLGAGAFVLLTSPDGTKKGGWIIDNNGDPSWVRVS